MFLVCHVILQDRYCGSGDMMVLVCQVMSQDHASKGSCDKESIKENYYPAYFGDHRHFSSADKCFQFVTCSGYSHLSQLLQIYRLAKFGGHRSCGNGDVNSYINTSEKVKFTPSIRDIERFSELGITIYNSKVPDRAGRETTKGAQAIAKHYAVHANALTDIK